MTASTSRTRSGAGSRVRIFNNTFLRNGSATGTPWTEVSTAETPNPYVPCATTSSWTTCSRPTSTWNGSALCTNAANCDWWNAASGDNITGDAAPPTRQVQVRHRAQSPGRRAPTAQAEAALSFVNATAGSENLHIQTGSVAWNAGADLTGAVTGTSTPRPASAPWDIGADELPAAAAPPLIAYSDTAASGVRAR